MASYSWVFDIVFAILTYIASESERHPSDFSPLNPSEIQINDESSICGEHAEVQKNHEGSKYRQAVLDTAARIADQLRLRKKRKRLSHGELSRKLRESPATEVQPGHPGISKAVTTDKHGCSIIKWQPSLEYWHQTENQPHTETDDPTDQSLSELNPNRSMQEAGGGLPVISTSSESLHGLSLGGKGNLPQQMDDQSSMQIDDTVMANKHSSERPSICSTHSVAGSATVPPDIEGSSSLDKEDSTADQYDLDEARLLTAAPADGTPVKPFLRRRSSPTEWDHNTSVIPLMSPLMRIPTCFRIAELLRLINDKAEPLPFAIELYAIPTSCCDTGQEKQGLCLADIFFPQRPPYICGIASLDQVSQFAQPSNLCRGGGGLVRMIVRPVASWSLCPAQQSSGQNSISQSAIKAYVDILSIRDSDWEEVQYVRGIVDPQK